MNNFNGPPKIVTGGASYADGKTPEQILKENTEKIKNLIQTGVDVCIVRSDSTVERDWKAINLSGDKVFVVSNNSQTKAIPIGDFLKWQDEFFSK